MIDLISLGFSLVLYVLQAIGLYAIATRRGIRFAWLAWVPVGSLWVLGAIADDFKLKTQGKRWFMRAILPVLVVLMLVLSAAMLAVTFDALLKPLEDVVSLEELVSAYASMETDSVSHMYEPVQEDAVEQLIAKLEAALTDDVLDEMMASLPVVVLLSLGVCVVSIAGMVVEYMCWYQLFASCDPVNKWLYLIISVVFSLQAVFAFVCRQKDIGMAPPDNALPGSPQPPQWEM